jgi:hypothetical protein
MNLNYPNPILDNAYNSNFTKNIKNKGKKGFTFDIIMFQCFILFYLQTSMVQALADLRDVNRNVRPNVVEFLRKTVHEYCK